jgi:xanthine dehydrogenase YagT iron-sulfur-binding subunit
MQISDQSLTFSLTLNGESREVKVSPSTTLLDLIRDHLGLTGTKKGCDFGACGACTVLADGRRIKACLALAASYEGASITTIEGIASQTDLHPIQAAFVKHDALQCGYCTPGQIMSAVALIAEHPKNRDAIREAMSGNLCRCGAYPNIVEAIAEVAGL